MTIDSSARVAAAQTPTERSARPRTLGLPPKTSSRLPAGRAHRFRALSRGLLAGPVCFATAVLVMCGGALWLPKGAAEIDNLVLPVVLFPLIWAALFFYTMLDRRLARAWALTGVLCLAHTGAIAGHVLAVQAAAPAPAAVAQGSAP